VCACVVISMCVCAVNHKARVKDECTHKRMHSYNEVKEINSPLSFRCAASSQSCPAEPAGQSVSKRTYNGTCSAPQRCTSQQVTVTQAG